MLSQTFLSAIRRGLAPRALLIAMTYALLASSALAEPADDAAALQLARGYFQHLDHQQFVEARGLMADSIVFEDPTWGGTAVTDPDEVIKLYSNTAGFTNVLLDERMAFVSNGTAVIHYVASLDYLPTEDSPINAPVPVIADLVRVATVENGKIVRHIDLAAYSRLQEALARAAEVQNDD